MSFTILVICSLIVQFIVERVKQPVPEKYRKAVVPLLSVAVGLVIAFGTEVGIFGVIGIPFEPAWVDYALTGVAYSGGSCAVNELIKKISGERENK